MSTEHKIFVAVDLSKSFEIYWMVLNRMKNHYQRKFRDAIAEAEKTSDLTGAYALLPELRTAFSQPELRTNDMDCMRIFYGFGEVMHPLRSLFACNVASLDYSDVYSGEKIVFMVGSFGDHEEVINIVRDALVMYGDTYECDEAKGYEFTKYEKVSCILNK